MVLTLGPARIACRIRDDSYRARYGHEFTLRSSLPSGGRTELSKVIEGWGDYFFYGFADENRLTQWFIGDLKAFRLWLARTIADNGGKMPGECRRNHDGSSAFRIFDKNAIPNFVLKAGGCRLP